VKRIRTRVAFAGLVLAGAAVLSIAFTSSGGAAVAPGVLCQADGKISGRGATFQARAQNALIAGFTNDVCGNVPDNPPNPGNPAAPAGNNMAEYNVYTPGGTTVTGSGYGRKAMACRTDAYGGTDVPYNSNQLQNLDTAVASTVIIGTGNTCQTAPAADFGTAYYPPFPPQDGGPSPAASSYPAAGDAVAKMMSFPVAGSAVAVIAHLDTTVCSTVPTSLSFTGLQISLLFGGDILSWNDPRLVNGDPTGQGANAGLANCTGAVTRVVRFDDSGTTQIFKTYLKNVDGARTGATCDPTTIWSTLFSASPNTAWPGYTTVNTTLPGQFQAATATCSALQQGDTTGNNGVLDECIGNTGGGNTITAIGGTICYADLPDFKHFGDATPNGGGHGGVPGCSPCTSIAASVQNGLLTAFQPPSAVTTANCTYGTITVPGGTNGAVGLTTGTAFTPPNPVPTDWDTWATDNPAGERGDVTNTGSLYPICGVTYGMVYTGLSNTTTSAIAGLTADQRRTLYAYESYILSSAGQHNLITQFYQALPQSLLDTIRPEFQRNF
jgi:ABC-type phosphate transport system substrate-binding protein